MNTTKSNDESAEQPAENSDQSSDQSSAPRRDAARTLEEFLDRATQFDRTAGTSSDAEEWFRAESQSLLHWAKETGRLLSSAQLDELIAGFKLLNGGLEHQVFFKKRSGRVFKITKPPHFGHTWFLRGLRSEFDLVQPGFRRRYKTGGSGLNVRWSVFGHFATLHYRQVAIRG